MKHFAAHVEDHPIDYGDFEGNIPAGNYGAGSVMLWDRGTFELLGDAAGAEQIARGDLKFRLHGEKLKGDFALVHMKGRGKGNEWLLIKKRDEFAVAGLGRRGARLQRALRPHAGGDRAESAGAQDEAQDRRRGRPRLGEQTARPKTGAPRRPPTARRQAAPRKKKRTSTSAA